MIRAVKMNDSIGSIKS